MPRLAEFLEEVAQVVERIPCASRAAKTFVRHTGHTAFRDSPASTHDGFAVGLVTYDTTSAFGREKQKQVEAIFTVSVGHAPNSKDDARERFLAEDVDRIVDVLEAKADWRQGSGGAVDLVKISSPGTTDRTNPLWWVTPISFRALVWGPSWHE